MREDRYRTKTAESEEVPRTADLVCHLADTVNLFDRDPVSVTGVWVCVCDDCECAW